MSSQMTIKLNHFTLPGSIAVASTELLQSGKTRFLAYEVVA